jgi:hypothetical protein
MIIKGAMNFSSIVMSHYPSLCDIHIDIETSPNLRVIQSGAQLLFPSALLIPPREYLAMERVHGFRLAMKWMATVGIKAAPPIIAQKTPAAPPRPNFWNIFGK